jgi:hypothetical protein
MRRGKLNTLNMETNTMKKCTHPVTTYVESFEFTCPHCGGNDLSEVLNVTRRVEAVYDDTPVINYTYDIGKDHTFVELGEMVLSRKYGGNRYVCDCCGEPLTDKEGNARWGGNFLYDWLSNHQEEEDASDL